MSEALSPVPLWQNTYRQIPLLPDPVNPFKKRHLYRLNQLPRQELLIPSALTQRPWAVAFISRCQKLLDLGDNWNTYGAPRINTGTLHQALNYLVSLDGVSEPFLAPGNDGGVQLEWEQDEVYVELIFTPEARPHGYLSFGQSADVEVLLDSAEGWRLVIDALSKLAP